MVLATYLPGCPFGNRYAINGLCSTDAGRSAADALEIDALELASVISNLCTTSSRVGVTAASSSIG
jgi:hypothetical protein